MSAFTPTLQLRHPLDLAFRALSRTSNDCRMTIVKSLSKSFRFVPPAPVWSRFDVGEDAENALDDQQSGVFRIPKSSLPPRKQLDADTVKLLERVSLTEFGSEKCLTVLEEAIRYADPLLTDCAFFGTTSDNRWSWDTVAPMYSLTEHSCPLYADDPTDFNPSVATSIMEQAPVAWEGYLVAPPGNIPVEPKGIVRTQSKQ
ncbi:unnamed protein product [Dicrocoelium dendriticum]|nr:unnamed protein product [Dicrocoelium dendriticum]